MKFLLLMYLVLYQIYSLFFNQPLCQICKPIDLSITTKSNNMPSDMIVSKKYIADSISCSQSGIVWYFHEPRPVGIFANGDYWVLAPVTIDSITPNFDGYNNGWEVNPNVGSAHCFQKGCDYDGFDSSLIKPLPFFVDTSMGILSIVKTTASGLDLPCLKTAAVLTVVNDTPPKNGSAVFRPPYVGKEKKYYYVDSLRTNLLPSLSPVANIPTLNEVARTFSKLRIDHRPGLGSRSTRPLDHSDDYVPATTVEQNNAILRLMINDPIEQKMQALVNVIQFGIDKIHCMYLGQRWPHSGGHQPGHRIVLAFAAVMLDIDSAKEMLSKANFFHGSQFFYHGNNDLPLWGESVFVSETSYWDYIMNRKGNKSQKDPYGYIDGGNPNDNSYQYIVSQSYKGEMLATLLMPSLLEAWNISEWNITQKYADRWVMHGVWTQPDPLAPYDGIPSNYGKTFGSQSVNIIRGKGRFPSRHGVNRDAGQYRSVFVDAMWKTYRNTAPGAENTPPFVMITNPLNGDTVNGPVEICATAFGVHGVSSVKLLVNGTITNNFSSNFEQHPTSYKINFNISENNISKIVLSALAIDKKGNRYESAPVTLLTNY